jgi:solute:Na+ symporter, SSS family
MSIIDFIVFAVYLIGIILFGISFYKKDRTSADYSTGSQTLPAWVIGLSYLCHFCE